MSFQQTIADEFPCVPENKKGLKGIPVVGEVARLTQNVGDLARGDEEKAQRRWKNYEYIFSCFYSTFFI